MKALSASLLALVMAALPTIASPASSDKNLQNMKGTVTYGASATPTTPLAPNATIALNDKDYAATGAGSEASISLPDSSKILMGQNSSVQLQSFDNTGIATAKFFVVGKVRFTVEHPAGAQANYTFTTSTGQIAVRGTVGDIADAGPGGGGGLQVNVYALSNPTLPVQVTLVNGQVFTLAAGQSLVVTAAAGALTASVATLSHALIQPFAELGPANAGAGAAGAGAAGAGAAAAGTTTAVTAAAVGVAAAATVVASSNKSSSAPPASPTPTTQPTLSPTPQPSTTSVPITVNGKPGVPEAPVAHPVGPQAPAAPRVPGVRFTPRP